MRTLFSTSTAFSVLTICFSIFSTVCAQIMPTSGDITELIEQNPSLIDVVASKYQSQNPARMVPGAPPEDSAVYRPDSLIILDSNYQFNPYDTLSPLKKALMNSGGMIDSVMLDSLLKDTLFVRELYADTALWNQFTENELDSAALDSIAQEEAKEFPHTKIYGRSYFGEFNPQELIKGNIPGDYILQEGDQVLFRLWGTLNHDEIITVGEDGFAFLEPFNKQVYLKGMSYRSLRNFMKRTIRDMAGVQGEMRVIATTSIKVRISGLAQNIGTFPVPPYYSLWQALVMSEGPSYNGSVRNIQLIRNGKVIQSFDLYQYLHKGKMKEKSLQEGDVIHFNNIGPVVRIEDGVRQPGVYEALEGEKLEQLVEYAGGLEDPEKAFSISIERTLSLEAMTKKGASREVVDLDLKSSSWKKFKIQNHDRIRFMGKAVSIQNHAWIMGEGVRLPGLYAIEDQKTTLWELIEKAGGLKEFAQEDIEVVRTKEGIRNAFTVVNEQSSLESFVLTYGDSVMTWHKNTLANRDSIEVLGNVDLPGKIFWTKNMSLAAALQRAGGALDGSLARMVVIRTEEDGKGKYLAVGPQKQLFSELDAQGKAYLRETLLEKNDRVVVVNKLMHQNSPPVTVLYPGQEEVLLPYSETLNLDLIIAHIPEFSYRVDSSMVVISNPEFETSEAFVKPTQVSIDAETTQNTSLIQPGAMVTFRLNPKKAAPEYVTILGEVSAPGSYAVIGMKESIQSVVERAGGFTPRANVFGVSIKRTLEVQGVLGIETTTQKSIPVRVIQASDKWELDHLTKAQGGDTIVVSQNDFSVEIQGAVLSPGVSTYNPDWNWEDYVNFGGGGVLDTADIEKVFIIYPNGQSLKANAGWLSAGPEIVSGTIVVVPYKPYIEKGEDDEFNYKEFIQGITIALSAMVAIVTIMQRSNTF